MKIYMETDGPLKQLCRALEDYSKEDNVTVEHIKNKHILHFDLLFDDSQNRWGNLQPKVSTVCVEDGVISSYNIRVGEVNRISSIRRIHQDIIKSRPPKFDTIDNGHSENVFQPHIRMNDNSCSIEKFIQFIHRLSDQLD